MIKKKYQGGRGIKNLIEEIMTNAGYQPGTVLSRVEYDPLIGKRFVSMKLLILPWG